MSTTQSSGAAWPDPAGTGGSDETPEAWQATRAQTALATQLMRDDEDAPVQRDVGQQISANERELFVSCAPPQALQQQFEHANAEFIAVHEIGTSSSRKLLSAIAAAAKCPVQKLYIRRQGYGTPLATIEYVELPTAGGTALRMYSTDVDADTVSRHGLARTLLAYSRLGVVMLGDLPAHSLESALKPLHDEIIEGPWRNRHLLLLPLAGTANVANQGAELARGTGVDVRTTPHVTRPADAWSFINGTWARLQDVPSAAAAGPSSPAGGTRFPRLTENVPAAAPLAMRPMPAVPTARSRTSEPTAGSGVLERYAHQLSELTGMVSCCIFELSTGRPRAHAGASPGPAELATHGTELLASIAGTCRAMGLGHTMPDAAITLGAHHLLLRPVPRHPGLALHAVLDKTHANLMLARLQIQRMDAMFDEPA